MYRLDEHRERIIAAMKGRFPSENNLKMEVKNAFRFVFKYSFFLKKLQIKITHFSK